MASNMSSSWDARAALFIHPSEPEFHCMGYAKTTSDKCCHNSINRENRRIASDILDELSQVTPMSSAAKALIRELASTVLCLRYHQGQELALYEELKRRMNVAASDHIMMHAPRSTSTWWPRRSIRSRGLRDPLVTMPSSQAPSPNATPSPASHQDRRDNVQAPVHLSNSQSSSEHAHQEGPVAQVAAASRGASPSSIQSSSSTHASSGGSSSSINADSAANAGSRISSSPASRSRSPQPQGPPPCTAKHVQRRPIDEHCSICFDPMSMQDDLVWCKAQCGKNFHKECFELWRQQCQNSNGKRVTCGNW